MKKESLFPLGQIVTTRGALDAISRDVIDKALYRHHRGDWGEVCAEDQAENDLSVKHGFRILSAYAYPGQPRFWIITEADRSATTVLLPSEY